MQEEDRTEIKRSAHDYSLSLSLPSLFGARNFLAGARVLRYLRSPEGEEHSASASCPFCARRYLACERAAAAAAAAQCQDLYTQTAAASATERTRRCGCICVCVCVYEGEGGGGNGGRVREGESVSGECGWNGACIFARE